MVCALSPFGSAKNFYCCRYLQLAHMACPLEVLRISTVVDFLVLAVNRSPLEVLRISTVVDIGAITTGVMPLEVLRISTVVDRFLQRPSI